MSTVAAGSRELVYQFIVSAPAAKLLPEIVKETGLNPLRVRAAVNLLVRIRRIETCLVVIDGKDQVGYWVGPMSRRG